MWRTNFRDLFAGEEAVADIVAPVEAPRDQRELEKVEIRCLKKTINFWLFPFSKKKKG